MSSHRIRYSDSNMTSLFFRISRTDFGVNATFYSFAAGSSFLAGKATGEMKLATHFDVVFGVRMG